jgi:hypothetical protein
MVTKIMENGILIVEMGAIRGNSQMETVFGGNSRTVSGKDMEHLSGLMDQDTLDNGWILTDTGME